MIRVPVTGYDKRSGEEISEILFTELERYNPDLVYSVTHVLKARYDMYDRLVSFCKGKRIPVVTRNAHSDTWLLIFRQTALNAKQIAFLYTRKSFICYLKAGYLFLKGIRIFLKEYPKFIIKRKSLRNSDLIIVQTKTDIDTLCRKLKIDPGNVIHLPKPVDQTLFREIPKSEAARILGLPSSDIYLLHVNNLVNRKGCDLIIKVLPAIRQIYPGIKLIITGNGEERPYLERLVSDMGVSESVFFTGHIDHSFLTYYYNIAEIMVLPTDLDVEGQPNALLEAIACKTNTIASDLPGPAAVIKNGLGLLIEPKNEISLRNAILRVLSGTFIIDSYAHEAFLSEYSFENLGKRLMHAFGIILETRNKNCK